MFAIHPDLFASARRQAIYEANAYFLFLVTHDGTPEELAQIRRRIYSLISRK